MKVEIDQGAGDILDRGKAAIEVARRDQPLQQVFRHRLAGLIVQGEAPQQFRLFEPVLVELRRKLDEIGRDAGAGNLRIGHVGKQPVQRVAELVEQGMSVIEAQQGRLAAGGLGEIAHVDDQRTDVARQFFLIAQRRHPGAASF